MTTRLKTQVYEDVPVNPVKSFFVTMFTRDISLADAILDLLDNSIDGILRRTKRRINSPAPYQGYYAEINYKRNEFEITDNCGGIPWNMHDYAFRMGRSHSTPSLNLPTVGTYGVGMKRAIFKIGRHCLIHTQNNVDAYEVEITPAWLDDEDNWKIPVRASKSRMQQDGTTILIYNLNDGIGSLFGQDKELFDKEFRAKIESHYAFIINKGFKVKVNGTEIKPRPTELRFESGTGRTGIRPFIYETKIDDVDIFLAVGLTHPIPSEEDIRAEQERKHLSSLDAGWTVICNDRAVVYCDRTELTGWGEAGVPKYHTQFISISGIVEFRSNDASRLPTTTTKRGIDASSRLYLQVKNKMREGLRMFTDFTNKWKGDGLAKQAQDRIKKANPTSLQDLKKVSRNLSLRPVLSGAKGRQYKPILPMPPQSQSQLQKIVFRKKSKDIRLLGDVLLDNPLALPSKVGEKCFDLALDEAKK